MGVLGITFTSGDLIAIVAIVVGGLVTLIGVWLAIPAAKRVRLEERRFDVYARTLEVVSQVMTAAAQATHDPDREQPARAELRSVEARLSLIGSQEARDTFDEWMTAQSIFWDLPNYEWPLGHPLGSLLPKVDRLVEVLRNESL